MDSTEDILQDMFMRDRLQPKNIDNNFKKVLKKVVTFITVSKSPFFSTNNNHDTAYNVL
jgi:hypothetical protein